jgi:hypothetical protein
MAGDRPNHAISFILITILIDTIGSGMIAPVMPELISQLLALGLPIRAAVYKRALAHLIEDRKALRSHRPLNLVNRQT